MDSVIRSGISLVIFTFSTPGKPQTGAVLGGEGRKKSRFPVKTSKGSQFMGKQTERNFLDPQRRKLGARCTQTL